MRGLDSTNGPYRATVQFGAPVETRFNTLDIAPLLQVATHPAGTDAVELVWELNDYLTADTSRQRSHLAVFLDDRTSLAGKTVNILASRDGETFAQVGSVSGPENRFTHRPVEANTLYHYRLNIAGEEDRPWGVSRTVLGAAGENLAKGSEFEAWGTGTFGKEVKVPEGVTLAAPGGFRIQEGTRTYGQGERVLAVRPQAGQTSLQGPPIPLESGTAYLQGGWIRPEGYVQFGRVFTGRSDEASEHFGYVTPWLRESRQWFFAAQLLEAAASDGVSEPWQYPASSQRVRPVLGAYGEGQFDDLWVVSIGNDG